MRAHFSRGDETAVRKKGFLRFERNPDSYPESVPDSATHTTPIYDGSDRVEPRIETVEIRDILQAGRQDLTPAEIASPATVKLLIAECDGLNRENKRLRRIEESYNELRIVHAATIEALRKSRRLDAVSSICLFIGSIGIGAAPTYIVIAGVGYIGIGILLLAGILSAVGVTSLMRRSDSYQGPSGPG